MKKILFLLLLMLTSFGTFAQQTIIRGKVTDAETGDPIPFANVIIQGTNIGTPTSFDGLFEITGQGESDTLIVSYIGYETKKKIYQKGVEQTINFQLNPEASSLGEFVITSSKGENPAFPIMRQVIRNKNRNDKRRLSAYEFDSYNKIEIDVDNITEKFRQKKFVQKITQVLDSIDVIAGEDGKPILPLFISETLSRYHFRSNPRLQKEQIKKTKVTGVGIEDGSLISQITGSSFQEYNFYQNRMNIVEKEFASPISDGWRVLYDYYLEDSTYIDDDFCYILEFKPKNDQELAFEGTMWITKNEYAIKRIDATMPRTANLNFIEKIKIQQELAKTTEGAWVPEKSRVLIDVGQLTKNSAGFLAKFYTSNQNIEVTEPYPLRFYEQAIELNEDANQSTDEFWEQSRHEELSGTEQSVIAMIDSLNNVPFVKTWVNVLKTAARGYLEVGGLDLGPWPLLVGNNDVEGWRVRLGGRTNENFSLKWQFSGYVAYGFRDQEYKYGLGATYIASRKKWTTLNVRYQKDIDQLGLRIDQFGPSNDGSAFLALTQLGQLVRPFQYERLSFNLNSQVSKALSVAVRLKNERFNPITDNEFDFRYFTRPGQIDSPLGTNFSTTEATVSVKFARDETFLINDNSRISLGTVRWPSITLSYTRGFNGIGGDFDYNRLDLNISQRIKMGLWGVSFYQLNAGKLFDDVPYPLLKAHIGNETPIFTNLAFSTMDFFEFVSDSYAEFRYQHFFEGAIMNRIPLFKKLKWRLIGSANVLYGNLSDSNLRNQPTTNEGGDPLIRDENGNVLPLFNTLDSSKPYLELGYGVENIFKVFRVDFFHRLNYITPETRSNRFAVKFSFNLSL